MTARDGALPPAPRGPHGDARARAWLERLRFDVRQAIRGLSHDWTFTLTAVATLAIAIALNVTVAVLAEAMLFRGLPQAARSGRLLYVGMRTPTDPACCAGPVRYGDVVAWRDRSHAFSELAFGQTGAAVAYRDGRGLLDLRVSRRSANTFGLLGVQPIVGRDFSAADETPWAPVVVIISHTFWQRRFNQRPDVVGMPIQVNGEPASIIGVLPEHFAVVYEQDVYLPLTPAPELQGGVIGRLRDGATQDEARVELDALTRQLERADAVPRGKPAVLTYAQAHVAPDAPLIYGTLWGGAWVVLLIASANVANLSLLRAAGRWRELATRIALGSGPARLARQLLVEQILLGAAAGGMALPITIWATGAWAVATASPYLALDYGVHVATVAYLGATAMAAALLSGVLPAVRLLRLGTAAALTASARGATAGPQNRRLASTLVGTQMALAVVLVLGAGVLVRSFERVVGGDTGVVDVERVTAGVIGLPSDTYDTPAARLAFFDRLGGRLRALPGITAVSLASTIPARSVRPRRIEIDGRTSASPDGDPVQLLTVSDHHFAAVGRAAPLGRDFNAGDDGAAPGVVIVNERLAQAFWPGQPALGGRLRLVDGGAPGPWLTVVGVAPNIMQGDATRQTFMPVVYRPFRQQPLARAFVIVRSSLPAEPAVKAVLGQVQALDGDVVTEQFGPLRARFAFDRDVMDLEHADLGKHAAIAPVFAVVALALAAVGLVAVIAHSVTQRTKEIGVRMAIGAAGRDIAAMVLREGMTPVLYGLVAGMMPPPAPTGCSRRNWSGSRRTIRSPWWPDR